MTKKKKIVLSLSGAFVLISVLLVAAWGYRVVYMSNFFSEKTVYVFVDKHTTFDELCNDLYEKASCKRLSEFRILAKQLQYPQHMKTGRYAISSGASNLEVLNILRRGQQTGVRITFNNIRFTKDLVKRLDEQLLLDSAELMALLGDSAYCASLGFNKETIRSMFIPNTYEVYWNISAQALLKRLHREYKAFWNDDRQKKAKAIGLSPLEVSVLASIVEEETAAADEFPLVAGLYLNRLRLNMPLQADPTVKYAVGDFGLKRILFEHLKVESPYNTYLHVGLPPAPLRIPSVQTLNAVLHPARHSFLYMCAKEDLSGRHNFAKTLAEHNRNARRYQAELNRRKIR